MKQNIAFFILPQRVKQKLMSDVTDVFDSMYSTVKLNKQKSLANCFVLVGLLIQSLIILLIFQNTNP